MKTQTTLQEVRSESELEEILKTDIDSTNKSLRIQAGHLPLLYNHDERSVELGVNRWGEFSIYTFELGARLVRHAIDSNKSGKLIIIVDDDVELPTKEKNDREVRVDLNWAKKPRRRLMKSSKLPMQYQEILKKYNLSEFDLVSQNICKEKTSVLISEKRLKAEARKSGIAAVNECAVAYKGLLYSKQYFDTSSDYLISFVPGQCKGNICSGVLNVETSLDSSHVFFPHIEAMGGILRDENGFRKVSRNPLPVEKMYSQAQIKYKKTGN